MTTVRLIAFDLDGTLLRSDGSLSARSRAALCTTREAGITNVLVTARPPRRLREIARVAGVTGLALCSNGAVPYDLDRDSIEHQATIDEALAHALVSPLRQALPDVAFAVEAGARYGCERHYTIQAEHCDDAVDDAMLRDDALALCALGATKLIVQHDPSKLSALARRAAVLGRAHGHAQRLEVRGGCSERRDQGRGARRPVRARGHRSPRGRRIR
jgi:hydroxymethylpyrimidine pyrophosphatase-like HAD family hydrolase